MFRHDSIGCRRQCATHYHELTELTATLKRARNWNVAVREDEDGIVFLHKIVSGAADKSYGIHVARLAAIPGEVFDPARVIPERPLTGHIDHGVLPQVAPR